MTHLIWAYIATGAFVFWLAAVAVQRHRERGT